MRWQLDPMDLTCSRDEAEVMGDRRVIDERVRNHCEYQQSYF